MSFQDFEGQNTRVFGSRAQFGSGAPSYGLPTYQQQILPGSALYQQEDKEFSRISQVLVDSINIMAASVSQMQRLVQQMGTPKDSDQLRNNLHNLSRETHDRVKEISKNLKTLGNMCDNTSNLSIQEKRKRTEAKLKRDFQVWLESFQEAYKASMAKSNQPPPSTTRTSGPSTQRGGRQMSIAEEPPEDEEASLLQANKMQQYLFVENEIQFNEAIMKERQEQIREVESTMLEINEILRDLGGLVVDQGHMIDNIERNIESAVVSTDEGVVQLQEASKSQQSSRFTMCCIMWLIIIAVVVVLGIVALGVGLGVKKN